MAIDIESIYKEIRQDIINLVLYPDSQIKEEVLAHNYNVSRTPVRAVISRLVQEKLLAVIPKKGTYVSKIKISDIDNDLIIRFAVESNIYRMVVQKITEDDVLKLNKLLDEQENIAKLQPSIQKSQLFNKSDDEFHKLIFKVAGYEDLWEKMDSFVSNFNRVRLISTLKDRWNLEEAYKKHRIIVQKLSMKDYEGAIKELNNHLSLALDGIKTVVDDFDNYFIKEDLKENE